MTPDERKALDALVASLSYEEALAVVAASPAGDPLLKALLAAMRAKDEATGAALAARFGG